MGHKHRTYRGKPFDMAALAASHDRERAVSNVPINAKGDIIDGQNNVVVPQKEVIQDYYSTPPKEQVEVSLKQDPIPAPEPEAEVDDQSPNPYKEPVAEEKTVDVVDGHGDVRKAKVKPKAEPKPAQPKVIKKSEVYEKHTVEGEVEIGRKKVTRDDGTAYWEVEYSDGSMMDIPIE